MYTFALSVSVLSYGSQFWVFHKARKFDFYILFPISQDFVMANFTEENQETDNDEEAMVEIKPDTQSLSQQSTGDSTFERRRSDRQPLVKRGRAWNDDDLRTSAAELELTAEVRQVLLPCMCMCAHPPTRRAPTCSFQIHTEPLIIFTSCK